MRSLQNIDRATVANITKVRAARAVPTATAAPAATAAPTATKVLRTQIHTLVTTVTAVQANEIGIIPTTGIA